MSSLGETRIPDFYDNLLDGYYFKEIVRTVLDISGYMVFPYGFESAFSYIKIQLHKGDTKDTPVSRKIRSSPDLLVYDETEKDVKLVEVKSRNWDIETDVVIGKIDRYKKYWEGSILTVIVPHGHWFYAQYVDELEVKESRSYNLRDEFEKFENIFTKVHIDTLYRFKSTIAEKMGKDKDHAHYFPEKKQNWELFFFPELLRLVKSNKGKTKNRLFEILNRNELVSMKLFYESLEKLVENRKIRKSNKKFYPL
ncbi:hypothetical protein E3J74_07135 [Candidatus Bathyarchaeota archaeon]|nr:MAG: hypothetical protein E3J74_07135 [Candidatus Bathyarchaeota archaeon]